MSTHYSRKKFVTIRDVAERAGVSIAEELGYLPNQVARNLKRRTTPTILTILREPLTLSLRIFMPFLVLQIAAGVQASFPVGGIFYIKFDIFQH